MAENKIPLLPPLLGQGGSDARRDQQELDILDLDAKLKRLAHREIGQRYSIKWIAIGTGTVVILGMFGLLAYLVHHLLWGLFIAASPALSVAMIVTPILSITTITVAVFIGAFRKFEEKDLEALGNGTMGALNAFKSGS